MWPLVLAAFVQPAAPPAPAPAIVDRPIPMSAERRAGLLAYRRAHQDPAATSVDIEPRAIVVHHTALPTLAASIAAFIPERLPGARAELAKAGEVNVSAHFVVDRDGTIVRLQPETLMARHAIGLNHLAIGIENVGGTRDAPLTSAQLAANARLIRWLAARFPITLLAGHHELPRLEGHPYFVERDRGYRTIKVDPGAKFMVTLRRRLTDLGLERP